MREDDEIAARAHWAMLLVFGSALLATLVGWVGGLGPPYREFPYDTAEIVGIMATFLLLPVAVVMTVKARGLGVPYVWRAAGWVLCLIGSMLPAIILANTFLNAPGYDVFGCGSLLDRDSYVDVEPERRRVCEPVRDARRGTAVFAAAVGGTVAVGVGLSALRPGQPDAQTRARTRVGSAAHRHR